MTTPTGSPDWIKPLPGGARMLVNDGFNLQALAGFYQSSWVDVTAYSGLWVQTNGFDLPGDFGTWEVIFKDAQGGQIIEPTFKGTWRGDLLLDTNVPVLGAQAAVQIVGPAHGVNAQLCVTGHGGGPGTDVCLASGILAKISTGALGAGLGMSQSVPVIREGAAQLHIETGTQPGNISVTAFDNTGAGTVVGGFTVAAGQNDTKRIWLPPMPVQLNLANTGAAAGAFNAFLVSERS